MAGLGLRTADQIADGRQYAALDEAMLPRAVRGPVEMASAARANTATSGPAMPVPGNQDGSDMSGHAHDVGCGEEAC